MNRKMQKNKGGILVITMITIAILSIIGISLIKISEGVHEHAVQMKNETAAMLAAEAAVEYAVFWMSQQPDMLHALQQSQATGNISFPHSSANYQVQFANFVGYRPVFEIVATGQSGIYERTVQLHVLQAITGWEMGMCRVPYSTTATTGVNFASGEIIDMPIHINSYAEPDDNKRDIYLSGDPLFLQEVSMSESRHSAGGSDKYQDVIDYFDNGIFFDQPQSRITEENTITNKMSSFRQTLQDQKPELIFTPNKTSGVSNGQAAVQLEFFVGNDGKGYVRITDDCTVRGYRRSGSSSNTWDYKIVPGSDGSRYQKYHIYGYHYVPNSGSRVIRSIESLQVVPEYNGTDGPPGGQIFVNGNVVIGSASENGSLGAALNTVQGKITVAATGNIWVADSIQVSDSDDDGNSYSRNNKGMPEEANPNVLGLVAQGVVKIIDPGMVEDLGGPRNVNGATYEPVGNKDSGRPNGTYHRNLPDPLIVEAAITVGGGGWGAENVRRGSYGGRKESGRTDDLILRGTLTEAVRGVVGLIRSDGYSKKYYLDDRLLAGVVPGNIWLKGKYIPTPGGWAEFRDKDQLQEN